MSMIWEDLCDALAEELDRQETVLAVCRAQQRAFLENHVVRVRETSESLEALIREAREAEHRRNAVTARIVQMYGGASVRPVLREIAALAPEPWKSRIAFYQGQLREVMAKTRVLLRENELRARRSAQIVHRCLSIIAPERKGNDGRYDHFGVAALGKPTPALLDARG